MLHGLLADLNIHILLPVDLFCDNIAAKYIAENQVFRERTKHLKVDCHLIRDYVVNNFLKIHHVQSYLRFQLAVEASVSCFQAWSCCSFSRSCLRGMLRYKL